MGKSKNISLLKRTKVIVLHKNGCPEREIKENFKDRIDNMIAREHETGLFEYSGHSGRRRTTSEITDATIQVISKRNRRMTASEITATINQGRDSKLYVSTVKRRLAEGGLRGCVGAKNLY